MSFRQCLADDAKGTEVVFWGIMGQIPCEAALGDEKSIPDDAKGSEVVFWDIMGPIPCEAALGDEKSIRGQSV
jgi:hypothetical protein